MFPERLRVAVSMPLFPRNTLPTVFLSRASHCSTSSHPTGMAPFSKSIADLHTRHSPALALCHPPPIPRRLRPSILPPPLAVPLRPSLLKSPVLRVESEGGSRPPSPPKRSRSSSVQSRLSLYSLAAHPLYRTAQDSDTADPDSNPFVRSQELTSEIEGMLRVVSPVLRRAELQPGRSGDWDQVKQTGLQVSQDDSSKKLETRPRTAVVDKLALHLATILHNAQERLQSFLITFSDGWNRSNAMLMWSEWMAISEMGNEVGRLVDQLREESRRERQRGYSMAFPCLLKAGAWMMKARTAMVERIERREVRFDKVWGRDGNRSRGSVKKGRLNMKRLGKIEWKIVAYCEIAVEELKAAEGRLGTLNGYEERRVRSGELDWDWGGD